MSTRSETGSRRLRREALAASALNHPHICTLHDVIDDDGRPVLVMEIVEGQPISAVIPKEGLPIETVVRMGEQLADALAHAHAHGIIHRDLKPSNIVVTPDGRAKVLDFGIARHVREADLAAVTHAQTALTLAGMIAGTLPYLAPEVLNGQPADARSDIWALGVVLYEMATGTRPFTGTTGFALTGAILHEPMAPLPTRVPSTLRVILQRCLAKEPSQRYQSTREIGAVLEMMRADPVVAIAAGPAAAHDARHRTREHVIRWSVVAALGLVIGVAAWSVWRAREPAARALSRLTITLPGDETLFNENQALTISPDGRRVAYVARRGDTRQIYVRPIDQFEARPIAGTEGAYTPFFSPDGRWLGFFASGKLLKVSLDGGAPVTLCDAPNGRGADWGPDDSIIFAPDSITGLFQVSAAGGTPRAVTTLDRTKGEGSHRAPQILPGGKGLLFTVLSGSPLEPSISVQSIDTGKRWTIVEEGASARYVPGGQLVYVARGNSTNPRPLTRRFDLTRLTATGPSVQVTEDLGSTLLAGLWQFAVSADGSLAFIPGGRVAASQRSLVWVDRHGVATPLATERRRYAVPRLSPDGQRLALRIDGPTGSDIWVYELAHDRLTRLTSEGNGQDPVWSPDGSRIVFPSSRSGPLNMFVRASDGSGPTDRVRASDRVEFAGSWSPDGKMLSFVHNDPINLQDIWVLSLDDPATPHPIVTGPGYQFADRISPDGRWLAYISDESGHFETYVTSFPNGNGKWQISSGGGTQPVWARNGRELFYRNGDKLMAVPVETRAGFAAGKPMLVFEGRFLAGAPGFPAYDVDLDGQRFVMIRTSGEDEVTNQVNVVLGWADELTRRAR